MTTLPGWSPCCSPCCNVSTDIIDISGGRLLAPESLAALRAVTTRVDDMVLPVQGHTTKFDGGGGVWIFDSGSLVADDDAFHVRPTDVAVGDPGRWRRL